MKFNKLVAASLLAAVSFAVPAFAELRISEICPKPTAFDPNGFEAGWIELTNTGNEAVNLSSYTLDRFNRGKAAKAGSFAALPNISVAPGARQVVYTSEEYPDYINDGVTPFVSNGVVVVPFKVNPKKYPMVRLLKGADVIDSFVIPVELDDDMSFAPAGGDFPAYTAPSAPPALPQPPAAVEIAVDPSKIATDATKGVTAVDATASLAATNIWSLTFTFTIPSVEIPGAKTGLPLFNAPGAIYAYLDPDGQLEFQVGSANFQVDYDGIWTDGQPHVVQLVCGPLADSRIAIAVDDVNYVDREVGEAVPLDVTKSLLFGQITDAGDWTAFNGTISAVKLYTGSLLAIDYSEAVVSDEQIAVPAAVSRVILPKPTKGAANNMTGAIAYGPNAGPLYGVKHSLSDWKAFPVAEVGSDYEIELMVNPLSSAANDAIQNVTLIYRAFAAKNMVLKQLAMTVKATDATAGTTYTATVSAADLPAAGGLLQWAAIVTDQAGNSWRTPSARSAENGYQWYGTIVQPTAAQVSATLPTWHFFCEQDTLDNMDKQKENIKSTHPYGVFCGIYDSQTGLYYDHVLIDLRGNTTAGLTKKSHSLKFLKSQPLTCTNPFDGEEIECRKTSLLAEYADPSRLRSCLSFYLRRQAGQDVPFCYPIRTQLNGAFYQLCFHTNRFKDELFEDYFSGYDPMGHAFKNAGDCDSVYCGGGIEQQLPDPDKYPNYVSEYNTFKAQFVSYVKKNHPTQAGMSASDQAIVDKAVVKSFDLPGWINFLALSRLTQECDDGWSTLCLYYDVNRTGTWTPMAYDVHQSFGAYYKGDGYGVSGPWADNDRAKCHPYYGGMRVVSGNYSNNISRANRAYECIYQSPKFRRLFARRLRTLMDELLKEPGTAQADTPFWNDYAAKLVTAMQADDVLDRAKWGLGTGGQLYVWSGSMTFAQGVDDLWNNYIVKRRAHFFNTHSVTNTAFSGNGYGAEFNACLPLAQSPISALTNGFLIVNVNDDGSFSDTEKVVIRNGNNEAVDMSGWKLEGAMTLTMPAGTVVDANDTITIVSDRKAYIAAHDAELTDQVIIGNAEANAAVTAIALKDATGQTVAQGMEPEETVFEGDYDEPVTLNMSGEKELNGANFKGGLILGSGVYELKNTKGFVNTASSITCAGTVIFKGKGTLELGGSGTAPFLTTKDLIISNGTVKVDFESAVAKTSGIEVSGIALVDDKGTLDIAVGGTQGYGVSLTSKDTTFTLAGGALVANITGTKCAAINIKGSCDAKFSGGDVTAVLGGVNAKVVNGGTQKFSGSAIDVTMSADITGMLEARPFNADKKIKISGGEISVDIPAYGSEAFATAEDAGTIEISGGTIELRTGDDCLSAYTDVMISGGLFYGTSISNDVIDANGDIAISGGTVLAYTTAVETDGNSSFGLDVNDGHSITITGGTVVALGGPDAHVCGNPAGYLGANLSSTEISGKYLSVTGATDKVTYQTAVKLPVIPTTTCTLLVATPGQAADATPTYGDTAPESGAIGFHDVYQTVEEIPLPPGAAPVPKDGKFNSFVSFKLSGYAGTTTLENFPVAIRLSSAAVEHFDYADCAAGGADIRFTDADGNFIPHEIDVWNPSGESIIWVKVPEVKPAGEETEVFMFFADDKADTAKAEGSVWADASYKSVWHLNFTGADTTDSVAEYPAAIFNPNDYCAGSSDSILGGGYHNEQNQDAKHCIKTTAVAGFAQTDGTATYSAWVRQIGGTCASAYPDQATYPQIKWGSWGNCSVIWNSNNGANSSQAGLELCYEGKADQLRKLVCRTQSVTTADVNNEITSLYDKQWHYFVVRWNGTQRQVLIDGVVQNNFTANAVLSGNPTGTVRMGARDDSNADCVFTGDLDEMRYRAACSSDDWINAEYANITKSDFVVNDGVCSVASVLAVRSQVAVAGNTATLVTKINDLGEGATGCDLYFAYALTGAEMPALEPVASGLAVGATFTNVLAGLAYETEYDYVFAASNNAATPSVMTLTGSFTTQPKPGDPSRLGKFLRTVQFTIDGYTGPAVDSPMPVLIRLSENNPVGFSYDDCASDGSDLRFGDADFAPLAHEIDTWDPTGESLVWVKVPALANGTVIKLAYSGIPKNAVDSASVWSDYTGVWHLNDAGAPVVSTSIGTYPNSTAVADIDGNVATGSIMNESGRFGKSFRVNDGGPQTGNFNNGGVFVLDAGENSPVDGGQNFTISGWFKHDAAQYYYDHLFYKRSASSNGSNANGNYMNAFAIEVGVNKLTTMPMDVRGSSGTASAVKPTPASVAQTWGYITFVFDGTSCRVYENGVYVNTATITACIDNNGALTFGNNCNVADGKAGDAAWCGWIDEVRFLKGSMSADWVAAEYAAMATADLMTAGEVEVVPSEEPAVKAKATSVKSETATLDITVSYCGDNAASCSLSFAYGVDADNLPAYTLIGENLLAGVTVEQTLRSLIPDSEYFYSVLVVNNLGVTNVVTGAFTTLPPREKTPKPEFGNFDFAIEFTTSGYMGSTELSDFPVLVRLAENSPAGFSYADVKSSVGNDIRFADADGNELPCEIDTWDPAGTSFIWVRLPSMTASTKFMMYYGGAPDTEMVAANTWNSKYAGIWHMSELNGVCADSTVNALDATPAGAAAAAQKADWGVFGNARITSEAAASKSYLSVPSYDDLAIGGTFTISGWVKMTATTGYPRLFSRKVNYTDGNGWEVEMGTGSYTTFNARGINNAPAYGGTIPSLQNNWVHLAFVYNDATLTTYANGVEVKSGAITAATDNGKPLSFGSDSDGTEAQIIGLFDECRLLDDVASADWVKAEYDQNSAFFLSSSAVMEVAADSPYFNAKSLTNEVSFTTAEISVDLAGLGTGATAAEVSFAYGLAPDAFGAAVVLNPAAEAGTTCTATLADLSADTTYFYAFCATNNAEYPCGIEFRGSFTTAAFGAPELETEFINGADIVQVKATVTAVGAGSSNADLYFTYGVDPQNLPAFTKVAEGLVAGGTYSASISDFESGVTVAYIYRAVNDAGIETEITGSFTPGIDFPRPDVNVAEFSRGSKFTVTGYTGTETLTNFPVLVRLSEGTPVGFSYADFYSADGSDLVFLDSDGNPIPHEIDTWNPQGTSLVWVTLPEMNQGTEFSMWYRSSKSGAVFNAGNPWFEYAGVWHLNEGGDGVQSVADSTVHDLTGTTHANSLAQPDGVIGAARRVSTKGGASSTNGRILVDLADAEKRAAVDAVTPTFTFSTWVAFRVSGNGPDYAFLVSRKPEDKLTGWGVQFNAASGGTIGAMRVHSDGLADNQCATYTKAITKNTWYKMTFVWDGSNYRAFYDGVQVASGALYQNKPAVNGTSDLAFGGMTAAGYGSLNGDMDEVRLRKGAMSADWIKADYDNETNVEFLNGDEVVAFTEKPKPIGSMDVTDFGVAYVQFGGQLASLGEGATAAEIQVKVWAADGEEPATWTSLLTGVTTEPFSDVITGLAPATEYNYAVRALCNAEDSRPSDVVEGSFTTIGTGAAGEGGKVTLVGDDYVHTYNQYNTSFTFTAPDYVSSVKLLLVGGGGAGGHTHGGGGAGGSVSYNLEQEVTPGATYTVEIGAGGIAATANNQIGTAGGATLFKLGDEVIASVSGGTSGGSSGNGTSKGGDNADYTGGKINTAANCGGGGAGAAHNGGDASNDSPPSGGAGGDGFACAITGETVIYGGGGGAGAVVSGTVGNESSAGGGGLGGGGKGARDTAAEPGVNGLGGGGGGGGVSVASFLQGANGGSGFAAIRYTIGGSGTGTAEPRVALTSASYADDLQIDLGYRVAWAGEGKDTVALKLLWGYTPNSIAREVAISAEAIGTGAYTFSAPLDNTTYYFRLVADNGDATAESIETLSVFVPEYAGDVPGDPAIPVISSSEVARTDGLWTDLSGVLTSIGEDAESCEVIGYLGLTDDVSMMTNQAPAAITEGAFICRLKDLVPGETYYAYFEVVNNLGASVASPVFSFTTRAGSTLPNMTTSASQQTFTVSGSLLDVGAGTTDIYVSWDNAPYELIASFDATSASTAFSSTYRKPTWGNASYKVLSSNECATAEGEMSGIYWTELRTGSIAPVDSATYTWKADAEGNWSGNWNDPAHWESNKEDCFGYPNTGSAAVSFANCTLDNPVTVTLDKGYTCGAFTCVGTAASDITFEGPGAANCTLTCGALPQKDKFTSGTKLTFRNLTFKSNNGNWIIAEKNNAISDLELTFSGVTVPASSINQFALAAQHSRVTFENGSSIIFGNKLSVGGTNSVCTVDNSTVQASPFYAPVDIDGEGMKLEIKGANPVLKSTGYFGTYANTDDLRIIFTVPEGGYAAAPIQMTGANNDHIFARPQMAQGSSKYIIEIDPESPALLRVDQLTDVVLVDTKKGFATDYMVEGLGIAPMNGDEVLGSFALSGDSLQLLLTMHGYIHEDPGFSEGDEVGGLILTIAQAEWLNSYLGEGVDKAAVEAAIADAATDGISLGDKYVLGLDPMQTGSYELAISAIALDGETITVGVTLTRTSGDAVVLEPIRGTLKLQGAAALDDDFGASGATDIVGAFDGVSTETFEFTDADNAFFKAVIE